MLKYYKEVGQNWLTLFEMFFFSFHPREFSFDNVIFCMWQNCIFMPSFKKKCIFDEKKTCTSKNVAGIYWICGSYLIVDNYWKIQQCTVWPVYRRHRTRTDLFFFLKKGWTDQIWFKKFLVCLSLETLIIVSATNLIYGLAYWQRRKLLSQLYLVADLNFSCKS